MLLREGPDESAWDRVRCAGGQAVASPVAATGGGSGGPGFLVDECEHLLVRRLAEVGAGRFLPAEHLGE